MSFTTSAHAYDRFMGRYSVQLSSGLADFAGIAAPQRALDVGCGPGALTAELTSRLGADSVSAVDPSEPFVSAAIERHPGVDIRHASAEQLPYPDQMFDTALAQLVVHFMKDPLTGLREMARVTRPNGVVAACVWDHAGGHGPLNSFWEAARELDSEVEDESRLAGTGAGELASLFRAVELQDVTEITLSAAVEHPSFDAWWEPFTLGVGPAGAYAAGLDPRRREQLREHCRETMPSAPFVLAARAWAARGLTPS